MKINDDTRKELYPNFFNIHKMTNNLLRMLLQKIFGALNLKTKF